MKIRSLVIISSLCAALGVALFVYGTRRAATQVVGPNLIVNSKILGSQWVVRDENLVGGCSLEEGNITPGLRKVVRFTVTTPNIGNADLDVGDPNEHFANNDGLFEMATCHNHFHFRHYALYQLIDPKTDKVWKAAKRGFCMLDNDPNSDGTPPKSPKYRACGLIGVPGNQGISAGWGDTYKFFLPGQFFVLDGGDGQEPVPPGTYVIRITVNPPFVASPGEPCPFTDTKGFCRQLPETNYDDNVGQVTIKIPAHPGREGVGPLKGDTTPTDHHHCSGDPKCID